jgi:hypothetical protein
LNFHTSSPYDLENFPYISSLFAKVHKMNYLNGQQISSFLCFNCTLCTIKYNKDKKLLTILLGRAKVVCIEFKYSNICSRCRVQLKKVFKFDGAPSVPKETQIPASSISLTGANPSILIAAAGQRDTLTPPLERRDI